MLVGHDVHPQHAHEHAAGLRDALLPGEHRDERREGVDIGDEALAEGQVVQVHGLAGRLIAAGGWGTWVQVTRAHGESVTARVAQSAAQRITHGMAALMSLMSGLMGLLRTARAALRACPDLARDDTALVRPGRRRG